MELKIKRLLDWPMPAPSRNALPGFAICVRNPGYSASLELLKLYPLIADSQAHRRGLVRVIDESGDDYLYPAAFFLQVRLTMAKRKALAEVARRRAA